MGVTECLEGVECAVFLYVLQDIRQMKEDEVRVRDYDFFPALGASGGAGTPFLANHRGTAHSVFHILMALCLSAGP